MARRPAARPDSRPTRLAKSDLTHVIPPSSGRNEYGRDESRPDGAWQDQTISTPFPHRRGAIHCAPMPEYPQRQDLININAMNMINTRLQGQIRTTNSTGRRSIRLRAYDYTQAGAYFVTICTHDRVCCLGEVVNNEMRLNDSGRRVHEQWHALPHRFSQVKPDTFVVMPNHIHGIFFIVAAQFVAPNDQDVIPTGAINRAPTVGEIMRTFKAVSTRRIHQDGRDDFAWQRNYYEHIIRNESALARIRDYIINNPQQWTLDRENPASTAAHGAAGDDLCV